MSDSAEDSHLHYEDTEQIQQHIVEQYAGLEETEELRAAHLLLHAAQEAERSEALRRDVSGSVNIPGGSPTEGSVVTAARIKTESTTTDVDLPATITQPTESEQRIQTQEDDEDILIPSTIDVNEEGTSSSLTYKETTAEAYNSFWKYKKFPKGPKVRQTYDLYIPALDDPHKPIVFSDPVFNKSLKTTVRHFGKARLGDGNDITPNPEKLSQLGRSIDFVTARMTSLGESSADKKEKMKLSSRICRMKRSANHEANKIKFAGLEREREELSKLIRMMKEAVAASEALSVDKMMTELYQTKVAGRTSEYVNKILEQTERHTGENVYTVSDFDSD